MARALSHPYPTPSDVAGEAFARLAGISLKPAPAPMRAVSESAVEKSGEFGRTIVCSADRLDLATRVDAFLRARYPSKTGEHVSADIGVPATTVQKWMDRGSAPSGLALVKMISAYGPEFLAAVMGDAAPRWLKQSHHAERRAQIADQLAAISAELQSL